MTKRLEDLRVMVVDDQQIQRNVLVRMLAAVGITDVLVACNGREGLDVLKSADPCPDVVISDLDMPEMDGIEFIRHLAQRHLARAVAVSSALEPTILRSVRTMATAYGLEVLGTLPKPPTKVALVELFSRLGTASRPAPTTDPALDFPKEVLEQALADGSITAHFQPQVSLRTGQITGSEALARWPNGPNGPVATNVFIPQIERHGLSGELTLRMLAEACRAQTLWMICDGLDLGVSVNVSASCLSDVSTADRYLALVNELGGDPQRITIEVTERAFISDMGPALDVLTRLRVMGFKLSIDDFGTGYASMEKVDALPFSELKIDQSFVHDATADARQRTIIETSLDLARKLEIHTVAEGIETQEDWDLLMAMGGDYAQGWFIARAMPVKELSAWAATWTPPVTQASFAR